MANARRSLSGRVVAITGAARGIGRATAAALLAKGCRGASGDLDRELAERAAAALGEGVLGLPLDVSDRASFERFLEEAERQLGPIDVLVNNAGIMPVTPFEQESADSIRRQVDVNLMGVITGTQLAMRRLRGRGSGHIVNIASQAGKGGFPGIATYSATKHGVVGLSEAVRAELRGSGVEVSCVMPTVVNTELTSGVGQRTIKAIEPEDVATAIVEALELPRFDVYVPRSNGFMFRVGPILPRGFREWLARAMRADRLMTEVDEGARRAYEERVSGSASEAADEPSGAGADVRR
jgi:NAD(P)-dependent dehydrogenase (short-subunit alcohol dehydrogenase family)